MQAVKGNRQCNITEDDKDRYVREGFDIYQDGRKVASGKRMVSAAEYERLQAELEEARKGAKDSEELIGALKEYASMKGVDIGQAATAGGILKKIREAGQEGPGDGQ